MVMRREFLGWDQPALGATVDRLRERYQQDEELDLERVVVVVPGSRAGRQLLELLVDRCEQWQLRLVPPNIATVGRLPELLYSPQFPFASPLVQQLTWGRALQKIGADQVGKALAELPSPVGGGHQDDSNRWIELARILWRLHRELAAEGLNFSDVARQVEPLVGDEQPRWNLLAKVQEEYHRILDGLELWDQQTARLVAIQQKECQTEFDILLVAVADMNSTLKRILDDVADRTTAYIFAPAELADRFDSHGCLLPETWFDAPVPLEKVPLLVAEGPVEQAETVTEVISNWAARYSASEIVVALPDERLTPYVERELEARQVGIHRGAGEPVRGSRPFRLLGAIADYLARPRFREFASLVRHPDLHDWIAERCPEFRLDQLDDFATEHLPAALDEWFDQEFQHGSSQGSDRDSDRGSDESLSESDSSGESSSGTRWRMGNSSERSDRSSGHMAVLQHLFATIQKWLSPLTQGDRPLSRWPDVVADVLQTVYADVKVDRQTRAGHRQWLACQSVQEGLTELRDIPEPLVPTLSASEALQLVLEQLADQATPLSRQSADIELLGWLELPLDLAPALVVTSFNDGFIPTSVNSDQFLPNSLRRKLNLLDNQRRYARDAYALLLLAQSRELALVVGRRDAMGDPLTPSRLAFAADDATIARRVLHLMGEVNQQTSDQPAVSSSELDPSAAMPATETRSTDEFEQGDLSSQTADGLSEKGGFAVPLPEPILPETRQRLHTLSVTAFRAYLSCPYRFYLNHVLRLRGDSDRPAELNAAQFGTLLHGVLDQFATGPCRDETDEKRIAEFLRDQLECQAAEQFGTRRLAAVNLQLKQLQMRLDGFARWQAERAQQGWRIRHQEEACEARPSFLRFDDQQVAIRGRIDRIDFHEEREEWMVLDYKSSDRGRKPRETHNKGDDWVDLQLPLYRHLAMTLGIVPSIQSIQTGYIVLPKDTSKIDLLPSDWTEEELRSADERAAEVARAILDEQFWPPAPNPPRFEDDYSGICQDSVLQLGRPPEVMENEV
jgi:ATP-dependent helicase/nuclease subunit B